MCFLKFIVLLLISSHISGGCEPVIKASGGKNVCSGQDFNLTCQLKCTGPSSHVKLVKEDIRHVLKSSNNNISIPILSANKNHSGRYSCQTENGLNSRVYVTVTDCSFSSTYTSEYLSTVNTTTSSLTNTTDQGHTPSKEIWRNSIGSLAHCWIVCSEWVPSESILTASIYCKRYFGILEPVLIFYMLFKTGVFLIISITAALIIVFQKR